MHGFSNTPMLEAQCTEYIWLCSVVSLVSGLDCYCWISMEFVVGFIYHHMLMGWFHSLERNDDGGFMDVRG